MGTKVFSVDLRPDPGGPGIPFAADLATPEGNRDSVDRAHSEFDGLDLVVPCAGFQHVAPVEEFAEGQWDALIAVLLTSPFLLASHAWTALKESGRGQIVTIASVHGLVASPFKAGYVSARHGVVRLTKVLALEGGPHGICGSGTVPGVREDAAGGETGTRSGESARDG
jgi:3-hydroxybutyrate dehydrogenase